MASAEPDSALSTMQRPGPSACGPLLLGLLLPLLAAAAADPSPSPSPSQAVEIAVVPGRPAG